MGRGRVQLKRIENKINRQVTFSKRRSGLMKKAHEISVLCEADVALIVFSTKGKLFEYASDSSMERILERYERYSASDQQLLSTDLNSNGSWTLQHAKLQNRIEVLQRNQRNLMGEDLDPLSLRELQNLEHQLENALKHIRLKKNQLMNQSIAELYKKEKAMQEQNNLLGKKIKEREKALAEQGQLDHQSLVPSPPPTQTLEQTMRCVDINRYGILDKKGRQPVGWKLGPKSSKHSPPAMDAWRSKQLGYREGCESKLKGIVFGTPET